MRRRLATILAVLALVLPAPAGRAGTPIDGWHGRGEEVRWSGYFASSEECPPSGCVVRRIAVSRPPGAAADDMLVSIHWVQDFHADLDLAVYGPDGSFAGLSSYDAGDTETVVLTAPADGTYEVVVRTVNVHGLAYAGRVASLAAVQPRPPRDLLPDLVPLPPLRMGYFHLQQTDSTCLAEETVERQALRCLRFDQTVANLGTGPFELRAAADAVSLATTRPVYQRIHRSDGTWYDRYAASYVFHATHRHFHYPGFALTRLWASDAAGRRLGDAAVREGRKNGFCLIDFADLRWGTADDLPPAYRACYTATEAGAPGKEFRNGISAGWADTYDLALPDQYVETSGLPDGYYLMETVADPDGTVVEADETNNAVTVRIQIAGDRVERLG